MRGLSGIWLKEVFALGCLARLVVLTAASPFSAEDVAHMTDVVVIVAWFMLREIELGSALLKDLGLTATHVAASSRVHWAGRPATAGAGRRIHAEACCDPQVPTGAAGGEGRPCGSGGRRLLPGSSRLPTPVIQLLGRGTPRARRWPW